MKDIDNKLNNLVKSSNGICNEDVNNITKGISNVFLECATKVGSIKCKSNQDGKCLKKNNFKINKKPWYNDACRVKRNCYFAVKRQFSTCKSNESNTVIKNNYKLYKKRSKQTTQNVS